MAVHDVLREDYRDLYAHLQQRMTHGDLSYTSGDTYDQYCRGGAWTVDRTRLHRAILDEFKAGCATLPRDGHAVLITAGPMGAGKGASLELLKTRQGDSTELGQALAEAHGVDVARYVVLDPDQFKEAIIKHGGTPTLPGHAWQLPDGRRLAPAELATLIHRESSELQDTFEQWARGQGYNLLYDGTMKNAAKTETLLSNLAREGYGQRVVLSVEVPLNTSLEQNARRWQKGRIEFDAGRDSYGGRMAPEAVIHSLYPYPNPQAATHSISRTNAEQAHTRGLLTGLIELDRGSWTTVPAQDQTSVRYQGQEASMHIRTRVAAAANLTSAATSGPSTTAPHHAPAQPRHSVDHPQDHRPGRSR